MKLNKKHINRIRKEKGYRGKPGSKLNKKLTLDILKRKLRREKLYKGHEVSTE